MWSCPAWFLVIIKIEKKCIRSQFVTSCMLNKIDKLMNVVFEEDFAKVWSDGYSPCAFAVMHHMPSISRYKAMCEVYIKLIKKLSHEFKDVYSISNLAESQPIPLEALFLYYNTYLPKQFQSGLRYKAYVKPKNLFAQFSLEEVLKNMDSTKVGVFDTFEEALEAVNRKRIEKSTHRYGQTVL